MSVERRNKLIIFTSSAIVALASFSATLTVQSLYQAWAINRLIADLASPDAEVRDRAINGLRDRKIDTLPYVLDLLDNSNVDVRVFGAWQLGQYLPTPPAVVDACVKVVTDESEHERVRSSAIFTLGRIGQHAHGPVTETDLSIIEALCVALESSNSQIASSAAWAIREYGPRADAAIEPLRKAMQHRCADVRIHAVGALMAIDPETQESMLPVLIATAQAEDSNTGSWAIYYLSVLGSKAQPAVPVLKEIAATHPDSSEEVNEAIALIEGQSD